jgi:hypothetical protein
MKNQTASAFGLYKSCHEQIYSYHNLYLTISVYVSWSQRCMNDACEKCMVELKQILVHTKCKFGPNSFLMCCLSLIHAVSQAKCQKSYLLNTLVLQELIINLSLHSRSTKIIIIPTYIEHLHSKSLTNQVEKQTSRSQGLFRWPSIRGSKKPWVRVWPQYPALWNVTVAIATAVAATSLFP